MPARTILWGLIPVSDFPRNRMWPRLAWIRPEIARSVVLLPAPFAPTSVTIWPSSTAIEIPLRAWMAP